MEVSKRKIEDLISAAEKIVRAQENDKKNLLFDLTEPSEETLRELYSLLDADSLQDPDKSYDLFYSGIQKLLLSTIPKDNTIREAILELKTILLSGKEKEFITYGRRGADSRMAETSKMESVIDILTEWSNTPHDLFKLAFLLLNKNKELGYIPNDREISDYVRC